MPEKRVKILRSGEITIPKSTRKKHNLNIGDLMILYDEEDRIILRKAKVEVE